MQEATAQVEERRAAAQQELDGMIARLSQLQHREATITQRVTELRSLFANAFSGFDFGDAQQDQPVQQASDDVDDSADAKSSAEAKKAQRDVQAALAESNESDEYSEYDESQEN